MQFLTFICLFFAIPPVFGYRIECENGTAVNSLRSLWVESKADRVFYNLTCQDVPGETENESCTETLSPNSALQATGIWSVRCTGNGYITGIQAEIVDNTREYSFFCCSNPTSEYLPETCHRRKVNAPGEYFELYLQRGEAFRGFRSIYDPVSKDRVFHIQICSFRGNTILKPDTYAVYSLSQTIPFGDVLSSYNYDVTCPSGTVTTRFDSMWSDQNQDRVFMIECSQVASEPIKCSSIRYIHADGEFPEDKEIYVPSNWTATACQGQEALSGWRSAYMDDIRRYRFGCCVLEEQLIDTSTCYWINANSDDSYVVEAPKGWVARGISARYQAGWRDRLFRFEFCQLQEYSTQPKCGLAYEPMEHKATTQMSQTFTHTEVKTVQECAMGCSKHPFCITAGFQPSVVGQDPVCFYSYRKTKKSCPETLVYEVEGTKPVWLYCVVCD